MLVCCDAFTHGIDGRVAGTADNVRLCFSLVNQDANAQGCGLPRRLVERMPVVVGEKTTT